MVSTLLLALAAVLAALIVALIVWGGRIEANLLVFGAPVYLVLDSQLPRVLLLFAVPALFVGGALSTRARRRRK